MKVILFLAAVYSLIINQCQEKDKTVSSINPLPVEYTQALVKDTTIGKPVTEFSFADMYSPGEVAQSAIMRRIYQPGY